MLIVSPGLLAMCVIKLGRFLWSADRNAVLTYQVCRFLLDAKYHNAAGTKSKADIGEAFSEIIG